MTLNTKRFTNILLAAILPSHTWACLFLQEASYLEVFSRSAEVWYLPSGRHPAYTASHPHLEGPEWSWNVFECKILTWGWVIMRTIVSTWRWWARKLRDRWWHVNRCRCPLECGWELGRSMASLDTEGWCWWGRVEGVPKGPFFFHVDGNAKMLHNVPF